MLSRRHFLMGTGAVPLATSAAYAARRRRCGSVLRRSDSGSDNQQASPVVDTRRSFVQPNHFRWGLVQLGMSQRTVIKLLGDPLGRDEPSEKLKAVAPLLGNTDVPATLVSRWTYGWLDFQAPSVPYIYYYKIEFDLKNDKVVGIADPFEDGITTHGRPSIPRLVSPQQTAVFACDFPHLLDLRWQPPSGEYPMTFEVEVERTWIGRSTHEVSIPHHTIAHRGMNPGSWRVRAKNHHGTSNWSEFRTFRYAASVEST